MALLSRFQRFIGEPVVLALIPALVIAFGAGALWAKLKAWPYGEMKGAYATWRTLKETGFNTRLRIFQPAKYEGRGVRVHLAQAQPGVTMLSGVFEEGVGLRLIDIDGKVLNFWPADFFELWPDPTHVYPKSDIPTFRFGYHVQGFQVDPDGSVVFNIGETGMAKLDACGRKVWTLNERTHHAVNPDGKGGYWAPAKNDPRKIPSTLKLPSVPLEKGLEDLGWYEDVLLHISGDGRVLGRISVLKSLIDGLGWRGFYDVMRVRGTAGDPTHVNDVEIVTPELAGKIKGVRPGDLLVSVRNLHSLVILDQDTGRLLWSKQGPWVRQHDPDIEPDGTIIVFNNNDDFTMGPEGQTGGSNVMRLDPATGAVSILYPTDGKQHFYTQIMGAQQRQPNGNLLIAETMFGRVFEVDPTGRVVWDYVETFKDKWAVTIESAKRYPADYFRPGVFDCPATAKAGGG